MAKIKVRIKAGAKGKPLGERIAQMRVEQGKEQQGGKVLYKPKAKLNVHFKNE